MRNAGIHKGTSVIVLGFGMWAVSSARATQSDVPAIAFEEMAFPRVVGSSPESPEDWGVPKDRLADNSVAILIYDEASIDVLEDALVRARGMLKERAT